MYRCAKIIAPGRVRWLLCVKQAASSSLRPRTSETKIPIGRKNISTKLHSTVVAVNENLTEGLELLRCYVPLEFDGCFSFGSPAEAAPFFSLFGSLRFGRYSALSGPWNLGNLKKNSCVKTYNQVDRSWMFRRVFKSKENRIFVTVRWCALTLSHSFA